MLKVHRISSVEWKPSAVVALATSADGSQVAAARADSSLEIWLVSPGSVGWHCQLKVLDSIGVSIWQIAAEPCNDLQLDAKQEIKSYENGDANPSTISGADEEDNSESEDEDDGKNAREIQMHNDAKNTRLAIACDDGCVRIYNVSDEEKLTYNRTLPRVSGETSALRIVEKLFVPRFIKLLMSFSMFAGRTLSVTWSSDANRIYSGSSDGITVGRGGLGSGSDLCIWSLLALRCGTIVSGDSSGGVQFWDGQFGTLLQAHSYHKGDVNALAAAPSHSRVFSAGSDGQVILYKLSSEAVGSSDRKFVPDAVKKWIYVGYVRAHTHDVRALTVATPISHEGVYQVLPHDICPAPQRMPMQLVPKSVFNKTPLLLIQAAHWLDIYSVRLKNHTVSDIGPGTSGGPASIDLVARVKCKVSRKIICSTISSSGTSFAYSDHVKPNLFELKRNKSSKSSWIVNKRQLPQGLPYAHFMVFSSDSTRLLLAGHDKRIYVVDVGSAELVHAFTPCRKDEYESLPPSEPPITKMFTSSDGQWLAAINCFGDVYTFNLETLRQHWFISRLDGASVTAGGFTPRNSNILIVSTSSNQEFPGEVIGLSFQPSSSSSSVIVYSPRATCLIDFGMPVDSDDELANGQGLTSKLQSNEANGQELTSKLQSNEANGQGLTSKLQSNEVLKRKLQELETKQSDRKNFEFCAFRDPVLFVEHLSKNSLLVIDKPWIQVVDTFDTQPVHRHVFGT
ncbi:hypothetical protein DH2020_035454 [Rehmannia glutinosa]|uniref:Uncharacterized protein n=1 Tax=Rehmannia glutinosa TaxID=99300 RepID=A0ABR0V7G8_REHGL